MGHIWPLLAASRLSPCGPAELPAVSVCGVVSGEDQCYCRPVPIGREVPLLVLWSRPLGRYNSSQGDPRFMGQTSRALDQFCLGFPTSSQSSSLLPACHGSTVCSDVFLLNLPPAHIRSWNEMNDAPEVFCLGVGGGDPAQSPRIPRGKFQAV